MLVKGGPGNSDTWVNMLMPVVFRLKHDSAQTKGISSNTIKNLESQNECIWQVWRQSDDLLSQQYVETKHEIIQWLNVVINVSLQLRRNGAKSHIW